MNRLMLAALAGLLGLSFAPSARGDQIYQALGVEVGGPPAYGMQLNGFFDGQTTTQTTFGFTNVTFAQYTSNGTATLSGLITVNNGNPTGHDPNYMLNINFTQVATPPGGDPTHQYYVIQTGGLRSMSDPGGDHATLTTFPRDNSMPFDVGIGAWNGDPVLQAVGWVGWTHYFNGQIFSGDTEFMHGDLLMLLVPVPEPSTLSLAFAGLLGFGWLFWRRSAG
jgi:PEP-CTERM motif